jgi:sugar phosphate isomerase/epimerase
MSGIKGPAIFLAQFVGDKPPYDNLESISSWAQALGYKGIQIPAWEKRLIDIDQAASSKLYCEEIKGMCGDLVITELASHLFGQLIAVHPAYDEVFDAFTDADLRNNPKERQKWAVDKMKAVIKASANLGIKVVPTFSGALLWHLMYPWPPRPRGIVEEGFKALASLWEPILQMASDYGIELAYEIHPGEDLHDGVTFERFLEATNNHKSVKILYDPSHFILQHLDYVEFIHIYGEFIKAFHVKDAELRFSGKSGVYGGYQDWKKRPGRFRSLGDGGIDFKKVFSSLTEVGFSSWAVLEWECFLKDSDQGAREGAQFIVSHLIETSKGSFDDFAAMPTDKKRNKRILGLE